MIVRKYGITLYRITEKDIELVRKKRNSAFVKKHMLYREYITKEMQKKWFRKIDNENNVFFIIGHGKKKIGLTNSANIDWKKRSGEGGIFIWDQDYVNTPIPLIVSLVSFEFFFLVCKLKSCYIKVLKDNARAQSFNEMFGFKRLKSDRTQNYFDYRLDAKVYRSKIKKTLEFVQKMSGDHSPLTEKDIDFSSYRSKSDRRFFEKLPLKVKNAAMFQKPRKR